MRPSFIARWLAIVVGLLSASCGRIGYDFLKLDEVAGPSSSERPDGAPVESPSDAGSEAAGTGGASSGGTPGDSGSSFGNGGFSGSAGAMSTDSGDAADVDGGDGSAPPTTDAATTKTIDLTDPTQTVRRGTAVIGTGELDLTADTKNQAGAAYLSSPYTISPTTSFTVHFSFQLRHASGQAGDGFAFLWQNDPRGTSAIGGAGSALGYDGITPSVVVEFDVFGNSFDPAGNNVGIMLNGDSRTAIANQSPAFNYSDGNVCYAWIVYDAATHVLSVFLSPTDARPAAPLVSATVDLFGTVGSSAYLGFSAGTGVSAESHGILSLTVDYRP